MKYSFKAMTKYLITLALQNMLKIFYVMPLQNNKMLYFSFDGKQYSDSPKYICLNYQNENLKLIWAFNDLERWKQEIPEDCIGIKKRSMRFLLEFCTSKIIVTNDFISSYLPVRKGQILLNTWHGGSPLKTVGKRDESYSVDDELFFKIHERKYTAILSSSEFMSRDVFKESLGLKGSFLEYGMPRNDIFFRNEKRYKAKVYKYFGIENREDLGVVLYAPTFRGTGDFLPQEVRLNVGETTNMLKKRFGKDFVFMFRAHHLMNKDCFEKDCLNASDYPDMQELLCAADILITDYSSCMGDFAFTRKPTFLYIPDVKDYMRDRGFYWDIYRLPFCIAEFQEELSSKILNYNEEKYNKALDEYFQKLGTFECGNATKLTCDWINSKIKENENEKTGV